MFDELQAVADAQIEHEVLDRVQKFVRIGSAVERPDCGRDVLVRVGR